MASCGKVRYGFSVMGLSDSVGHGDLDMMMSLLTNPWLGLSQIWVSSSIADATSILALRVFFPLHRGVIVRVMMIWFIHGVFPGMIGFLGLVAIDADGVLKQICAPRRIWNPEITSETFVVKIFNDIFGLRCMIGWNYTGATGFLYVMWSFKQRMPIWHTYHIQARWLMKKEHNMVNNMLASKAYRKDEKSFGHVMRKALFVRSKLWDNHMDSSKTSVHSNHMDVDLSLWVKSTSIMVCCS